MGFIGAEFYPLYTILTSFPDADFRKTLICPLLSCVIWIKIASFIESAAGAATNKHLNCN
ncbi:hypothetical protein D18P1_0303665 [Aggregatibacter actinomycetemcomitans serotype f str. D18P1]|nr:hypothetical protein D18P1_0303665 [Aggregatibacter actinomycetemcomitans serotype f str. D18P1]KYK87880.1 hypothetical protein SC29R_05055 [Aggregatibacter actinomycetemcomitans serotype f str. SC29R]